MKSIVYLGIIFLIISCKSASEAPKADVPNPNATTAAAVSTADQTFQLFFERGEEKMKVKCKKGCGWSGVSFPLTDGKKQVIFTEGTGEYHAEFYVPQDTAKFEIVVSATDDIVTLQSLKGTSWNDLYFTCKVLTCNTMVDNNGQYEVQ